MPEMAMIDIFVVTRTHREYEWLVHEAREQWKEEIKRRQVHYVESPWTLKGIHGARVFLYGAYFKRIDWPAIDEEIRAGGHRKLLMR